MKNETKRNSIIIGALLITIALMTIGYASLAAQLTIKGTASIRDASWNISFLSIIKNTSLSTPDAVENSAPTASGTAISFDVSLAKPGSTIVYDVIVQNTGTIDATFKQVLGVDVINAYKPTAITYDVKRLDPQTNDELTGAGDLLASDQNKFRVTITWNADDQNMVTDAISKPGTIYIDYQQKTS